MEPKKICKTKHAKIIFLNIIFLSLILFGFQTKPKIVLGPWKQSIRKEKNGKEKDFLILMSNAKCQRKSNIHKII